MLWSFPIQKKWTNIVSQSVSLFLHGSYNTSFISHHQSLVVAQAPILDASSKFVWNPNRVQRLTSLQRSGTGNKSKYRGASNCVANGIAKRSQIIKWNCTIPKWSNMAAGGFRGLMQLVIVYAMGVAFLDGSLQFFTIEWLYFDIRSAILIGTWQNNINNCV